MEQKYDYVNITELKGEVNLLLFKLNGIGLKELLLSNKICEIFGGATNETINVINNTN